MRLIKRVLVLMAMVVLTCGVANAEFRFGIKAGLNVNKIHLDEQVFNASNRAGFTAGVMTEFTVPIIGIGMDLSVMYTKMNSEMNSGPQEVENYINNGNIGKDFLQIPLNLKYKLSIPAIGSIIKPMIFTGPSFNFNLNKSTLQDIKSKSCQIAWNLGAGVELIKHLQISASYSWGLNKIAEFAKIPTKDIDLKNNYWTVTAAWLF